MTAVRAVMKETANRGGLIFRQRGCPLGRMVSVLHFFTGGRSAGNRNQPRCPDCNDKQGSQLCEQVSNLEQRPARQEDKIASASLLSDRVVNFHEYPDLSTLRRAHVPREFGAAGARPLTCLYLLKLQKDFTVRAAVGRLKVKGATDRRKIMRIVPAIGRARMGDVLSSRVVDG